MDRYLDPGATTEEAYEISKKSRTLAREIVGDSSPRDRIKQRVVVATGDPRFADLMRFGGEPIGEGIRAIEGGRDIVADISMVDVGVTRKGHGCEVKKALGRGDALADEEGITRTAAGFLSMGRELEGSVVVVGNAPSAALAIHGLLDDGVRPSLVIATPVGFVNAAESKDLIHGSEVDSITCSGTRGGSAVAVASVNELITMVVEDPE